MFYQIQYTRQLVSLCCILCNKIICYRIQYRVLRRGCELLALGGRLVYSTCSFNPVENEAVIHRLLQEVGDAMKLIDVVDLLPGLKFHKGTKIWHAYQKLNWFSFCFVFFQKLFKYVPYIFIKLGKHQVIWFVGKLYNGVFPIWLFLDNKTDIYCLETILSASLAWFLTY